MDASPASNSQQGFVILSIQQGPVYIGNFTAALVASTLPDNFTLREVSGINHPGLYISTIEHGLFKLLSMKHRMCFQGSCRSYIRQQELCRHQTY